MRKRRPLVVQKRTPRRRLPGGALWGGSGLALAAVVWRGQLDDCRTRLEARGDTPEAVVAELARQYVEDVKDRMFA